MTNVGTKRRNIIVRNKPLFANSRIYEPALRWTYDGTATNRPLSELGLSSSPFCQILHEFYEPSETILLFTSLRQVKAPNHPNSHSRRTYRRTHINWQGETNLAAKPYGILRNRERLTKRLRTRLSSARARRKRHGSVFFEFALHFTAASDRPSFRPSQYVKNMADRPYAKERQRRSATKN